MITQLFEEIKKLGLDDFGILYVGFMGIPEYGRLSNEDISEYASAQLIINDNQDLFGELINLLLIDRTSSRQEVEESLAKIVDIMKINLSISRYKWLLVSLRILLNNLSSDPVYGLLQLSQFWISWDEMENSPHTIQGVNDDMPADIYYSEENFKKLIEKNYKWLDNKLKEISCNTE